MAKQLIVGTEVEITKVSTRTNKKGELTVTAKGGYSLKFDAKSIKDGKVLLNRMDGDKSMLRVPGKDNNSGIIYVRLDLPETQIGEIRSTLGIDVGIISSQNRAR